MSIEDDARALMEEMRDASMPLVRWLQSQGLGTRDAASLCVLVAGALAHKYYDESFVEHLKIGVSLGFEYQEKLMPEL